jgi:CHAT domain-containing protein
LRAEDEVIAFIESWRSLRDELVQLLLRRSEIDAAFLVADTGRSAVLREHANIPSLSSMVEVVNSIPPDAVLIEYATVGERLVAWTVSRAGVQFHTLSEHVTRVQSLADEFARSVHDNGASLEESRRLFDILLRPLWPLKARRLIVVPTTSVQPIPFAVLWDGSQYLVRSYETVFAPSAALLVTSLNGHPVRPVSSVLVVSAPFRGNAEPDLPAARVESRRILALFGRAELLTGLGATTAKVIAAMPRFEAVHFAVHANRDALTEGLLLTPTRENPKGYLTVDHVWPLRFRNTSIVTLAACSTANGSVSESEGELSLVRAFLAAGAHFVVASRTPVDDAASSELFERFYRALRSGVEAPTALREAQLALLDQADRENREWASYSITER